MPLKRGDTLSNHWYLRPGWTATSRYLTWHLLPDQLSEVHSAVTGCHNALRGIEGLDLVPIPWLHMTVQGIDFSDRVSAGEIGALVAATSRRVSALSSIDFSLSGPAVYGHGVALDAVPGEPVALLRTALRAAIAEVRGPEGVPGDDEYRFRPHVSIAYANAEVPAAPVLDALERAPHEPVSARFSRATLIELRREGRLYCWERIADIDLKAP